MLLIFLILVVILLIGWLSIAGAALNVIIAVGEMDTSRSIDCMLIMAEIDLIVVARVRVVRISVEQETIPTLAQARLLILLFLFFLLLLTFIMLLISILILLAI